MNVLHIQKKIVERLDYHVERELRLPREYVATNALIHEIDRDLLRLIVGIRLRLWGEKTEPVVFRYPASWWQHVKDRFFARWMKRRWPVQYKEARVSIDVLYPDFRPMFDRYLQIPRTIPEHLLDDPAP